MLVHDLTSTVAFYCDVLGFEVVVPPNGMACALVRHGEVEILFQPVAEVLCTFHARPILPLNKVTLRMYVPDVAAFYEHVRDRVEVVRALQLAAPGEAEFSIRDCNGLLLTFTEAA